MSYPKIVKIRQILDNTQVEDIGSAIKSEMNRLEVSSKIKSGSRVAISAGSRGITDIATIISSIVREVKAFGGDPFIIPAMGSHGGATATGQKDILVV
jgi:DNA topoisomerase VI subunit B